MSANAGLNSSDCDASGLQYQTLDTLTQFEAIAVSWDRLLERSQCNRVFSCSRWFAGACAAQKLAPRVLLASRGGELAAILPLIINSDNSIEFATFMSDYNDMIAQPDDLPAQAGLLEYALGSLAGYQLAFINIRPDSNCLRAANALAATQGISRTYEPNKNCFYISLGTSFDDYLAGRSHAFRKGLHRIRRNSGRAGLEVRQLTPANTAAIDLPELFLSLNTNRFQDKSGFRSEAAQSFVRAVFPQLFAENRLTAFGLFAGSRVIAIDLCMRGARSLCTWNGGFLAEAAQWSPGRLLLAAGIEYAFAAGLEEYDLLRGLHPYKASWATHSRSIGKLVFNNQSCRDTFRQHESKSAYSMQR